MANHGYMREGYGLHGDAERGRDDWRDDRRDDWRDEDRARRGMMFRDDEDRRMRDRDDDHRRGDDRGFFERAGDEVRSWFRDDADDRRERDRERSWRGQSDDRSEWFGGRSASPRGQRRDEELGYGDIGGTLGGFGNQESARPAGQRFAERGGRFGSSQDDHYRSWRDRQIAALDRDYQDYCREREDKFHSEFDSWRQGRQGQNGGDSPRGQGAPSGGSPATGSLSSSSSPPSASGGSSPTPDLTGGTQVSGDKIDAGGGGRARPKA